MIEEFTLDTQAILLLCSDLGRSHNECSPLTLPQYNAFSLALHSEGKRPSDLLTLDEPLIEKVCIKANVNARVKNLTKDRILSLLCRGVSLSSAIGRWAQCGIHVISRADENYPQRMKEYLKSKAPSLLYFAGNADLMSGGGLAVVGARDLNKEAEKAIQTIVRGCIDLDMPIVSGGARGADQTAMQEAFLCGGKVIGVLPCDLLKGCLVPENREALAKGKTLLLSAYDPEVRPYNYGSVAMDRNKYIYAMANGCFVAQSGIGSKSGTWSGAAEDLKRDNHHPVFVFLGNPPSEGCLDLQRQGAKVWDMNKTVSDNLSAGNAKSSVCLGDLFSIDSSSQSTTELEKSPNKNVNCEKELQPYDLFVRELRFMASSPQRESEIIKKLEKKFDLMSKQCKKWIDRAVEELFVERKIYQVGKRGSNCIMIQLIK